jgi:molybdopterin synthase catalytic subunit
MGAARIEHGPLDVAALVAEHPTEATGAVTLYVGTVRGDDDGRAVDALTVEVYEPMAERELERLRTTTIERFGLEDATVVHRAGRVAAGEPIVAVLLWGRHRKETYAAMDHLMDQLKRRVPIWKQEDGPGGSRWVAAVHTEAPVP